MTNKELEQAAAPLVYMMTAEFSCWSDASTYAREARCVVAKVTVRGLKVDVIARELETLRLFAMATKELGGTVLCVL
jgi:hypothetical protein